MTTPTKRILIAYAPQIAFLSLAAIATAAAAFFAVVGAIFQVVRP